MRKRIKVLENQISFFDNDYDLSIIADNKEIKGVVKMVETFDIDGDGIGITKDWIEFRIHFTKRNLLFYGINIPVWEKEVLLEDYWFSESDRQDRIEDIEIGKKEIEESKEKLEKIRIFLNNKIAFLKDDVELLVYFKGLLEKIEEGVE